MQRIAEKEWIGASVEKLLTAIAVVRMRLFLVYGTSTMPRWYVKELGFGTSPVSEAELRKLVKNGVIDRTSLIQSESGDQWIPANSVSGLFVESMKACPFCGESVLEVAIKCKHCGEFLDGRQSHTQPIMTKAVVPKWSPGVAAALSFILPGLGQMYKGQVVSGIVWCILTVIGYALFVIPGIALHLWAIVDAAKGNPYEGAE